MTAAFNTRGLRTRQRLFRALNAKLSVFEPRIGSDIICPICWRRFGVSSLLNQELSIEHVPPVAAARLIGERRYQTLTCRRCNNTIGSRTQKDLRQFLVAQLHLHGQYSGAIPGTITVPGASSLRSNITWTPKKVGILGVPKANNPATTEAHIRILEEIAASGHTNWTFGVNLDYGCKLSTVWLAYLHAAYLAAFILTDCSYSFTKGGTELRRSLVAGNLVETEPCIIQPSIVGVGGKPWIAKVTRPQELRCYWVKVAGNVVVLPFDEDEGLDCHEAWRKACEKTPLGLLRPRKLSFRATFQSEGDAIEAARCFPGVFQSRFPA